MVRPDEEKGLSGSNNKAGSDRGDSPKSPGSAPERLTSRWSPSSSSGSSGQPVTTGWSTLKNLENERVQHAASRFAPITSMHAANLTKNLDDLKKDLRK